MAMDVVIQEEREGRKNMTKFFTAYILRNQEEGGTQENKEIRGRNSEGGRKIRCVGSRWMSRKRSSIGKGMGYEIAKQRGAEFSGSAVLHID